MTRPERTKWSTNRSRINALNEKYNVEVPESGFAGHPPLDGDLLICVVGGEGITCIVVASRSGLNVHLADGTSKVQKERYTTEIF